MLFNSIEFLIYLPIVFVLYWYVFQRNLRLQNLFVVIVSYVFYGWWDWRFLLLIAFTSFFSWLSGIGIDVVRHSRKSMSCIHTWCKGITVANIGVNLAILGLFKYYNFFVESFVEAFDVLGISLSVPSLKLILPVGISFYTFQALSYTIDVYKKKLSPTHDVVAFFAYVSFFPQLVAGPIERATNLLPQFYCSRHFDYDQAVDGMRQMLWGFFKKVVVADNCAAMANIIFDDYETLPASTLFLGAVYFTFQIYGDFSGYSDIVIGTARLFGIELKRNFHYPYFSRDIAEFWRKWHISLTTWFRDYIYIPLGGSRVPKLKVIRNTFIIFLVSGLWHGANWTFIAWGGYHACLFLPLLVMKRNRKYMNEISIDTWLPSVREFVQMTITFLLVVFGWIFFRAENINHAFSYIRCLCDESLFTVPGYKEPVTLIMIMIMIIVEWINRKEEHGLTLNRINSVVVRYVIYWSLILIVYFYQGKQEAFIYFQF